MSVPPTPEPPRPSVTRRQGGILSWPALATTVPPALIYAAETLYFKTWQTQQGNAALAVLSALPSWIPDLVFALSVLALFSVLVSARAATPRRIFVVLYITLMAFAVIFTAGHYAYLSATGSALTWSVLEYFAKSLGDSGALVWGEATPLRLAWLGVPLLALAISALVTGSRPIRRRLNSRGRLRNRTSAAVLAALILAVLGLALVLMTAGPKPDEARCIAWDRLRELVGERGARARLASVADHERFDDVWAFALDPGAERLNIVVFIFESLGWRATDVYHPGLGATPYLAELARRSLVARHFYTVVPHTTKALVPILAGYYPSLDLEPKEARPGLLPRQSLAAILGDQGYATAFFQTANDFEQRRQLVANLGFNVFHNLFTMPQEGFDDVGYFGKEERMMLEPSLAWVDAQAGRPFFLTYLTLSSHHPYGVPRSWRTVAFPGAGPDQTRYLNAVRQTDAFLRQVMAGFEARGLVEKTLFVIVGDHGEAFGEHGGYQHNQILWEEGLRTVALLHGPPAFSRGRTIEGPRSLLDVIPTVCDALGLRLVEGRFLGESLLAPVPEDRKLYFSGWTNRSSLALREGPVKTIYHFGRAPAEVYDNSRDPDDRHDLAGQGPYDAAFIKVRTDELLHWQAVVTMQYLAWEKDRRRPRP